MCGIAAQHGSTDASLGRRMLRRLAHRGPDDEGCVEVASAWLGHRRLSIVDLDGGHQPLSTQSPQPLYLVCNGEIYNHLALRRELGAGTFTTRSDSEAVLRLVELHGVGGLERLRGMYAFVAADADGRFVAARDPLGIKPLYWATRAGSTHFASELRAFDPAWRPLVRVFPPGHAWTPRDGLRRFAGLGDVEHDPCAESAPSQREIREALVATVEREMMGDVPVGVFLSGGLDSSLVAAIAARRYRATGETLQTFAVGTAASSDRAAARRLAAHLGTDHHEVLYRPADAIAAVPRVVRTLESFDPALVRSAVANFLLAREAARHVKVVLTGEGSDELFGGYAYMREIAEHDLHDELVRTLRQLHTTNLQRCDRVTMAHGLEARVPFLDLDFVRLVLRLPAASKAVAPGRMAKHVLRAAFEGWLPADFLWREKAQFHEGSGATDVLSAHLERSLGDGEFRRLRTQTVPPLRTKEEAVYFRSFSQAFPGIRPELTIERSVTT